MDKIWHNFAVMHDCELLELYPQESYGRPRLWMRGCWKQMQRNFPKWMKSEAPMKGMQINIFTLVITILLPLILVGFDAASDMGVIGQMWSYITYDFTEWTVAATCLIFSIFILSFSMSNLIFSNPWASLLINARTTILMKTRELERKDVPVPLGECNC